MSRCKIHILYEHGADPRPYGISYIRLLRPLTHPRLRERLDVTWGLSYDDQVVDAVIVDRLWRPDMSLNLAESLAEKTRRAGAHLIYAIDDDLIEVLAHDADPSKAELPQVIEFFLRQADGVLVTTVPLRQRFAHFNPNIVVVPNALDERLLLNGRLPESESPFGPRRKVIGYMGTFTHDDDLAMILPALQAVCERHPGAIEIQIVGAIGRAETLQLLKDLPVRVLRVRAEETEYPLFMLWFGSRVRWDVAIAPLRNTRFNECKSDVKFLDYSAIGTPGVYSRVRAYASSVRHMETGWLAGNEVDAWVDALEELLADDELRARLAGKAARYLYTERILDRCAHNWLEALDSLLDGA